MCGCVLKENPIPWLTYKNNSAIQKFPKKHSPRQWILYLAILESNSLIFHRSINLNKLWHEINLFEKALKPLPHVIGITFQLSLFVDRFKFGL